MRTGLLAISLCLIACAAYGESLDEAFAHVENKRYEKAAPILEKLSAHGNHIAQFLLATEISRGNIVSFDPNRKIALLISSARQKYTPAQLGLCMHHDDPTQAYAWCEVVATKNDRYSRHAKQRAAAIFNNLLIPAGAEAVEAAKAVAASYVRYY